MGLTVMNLLVPLSETVSDGVVQLVSAGSALWFNSKPVEGAGQEITSIAFERMN